MKAAALALRIFVGVDGALLIILGLFLWVGSADTLIPVHITLGVALVLALWILAAMAAVAGVNPALVAVAALWGVIVPILGLTQERLLPGDLHWLIQTLHLLVGITAIALAQILAIRITRRRSLPPAGQSAERVGGLGDALD